MPTETLYVNAFSATTMNWNTHTGVSPWLQAAAGNSITAFTNHVVDDSFAFADTAVLDFATITSIKLAGQIIVSVDVHQVELLLSGISGGAWSTTVFWGSDEIGAWVDVISGDLKATISSLARINECAMKATKHNVGAGTLSLRRVYLEITYTSVSTVTIKPLDMKQDKGPSPRSKLRFRSPMQKAFGWQGY